MNGELDRAEVADLSALLKTWGVHVGYPAKRNLLAAKLIEGAAPTLACVDPRWPLPTTEIMRFLREEAEFQGDKPDSLLTHWFETSEWPELWRELSAHRIHHPHRNPRGVAPEVNRMRNQWTQQDALAAEARHRGVTLDVVQREREDRIAYERLIRSSLLEETAIQIYREEGSFVTWDTLVAQAIRHATEFQDRCLPLDKVKALLDVPKGARAKFLAAANKRIRDQAKAERNALSSIRGEEMP
jgi:hypothetical protein